MNEPSASFVCRRFFFFSRSVYGNNITHYNTFLNGSSPLLKTWLTYISSSSPSTLHNLLSPRYSPIKSHPSQLTSYPTIPPTLHNLTCYIDPISISSQRAIQACELVGRYVSTTVFYVPKLGRGRYNEGNCPVKRYYSLGECLFTIVKFITIWDVFIVVLIFFYVCFQQR